MLSWTYSVSLERNFECQYENLDAYQSFAKFHESSKTKSKALSLSENKIFLKNDLRVSCSRFAELKKYLV